MIVIKALEKAWYKKAIVKENEILEYDGDKVPCWATLATAEEENNILPQNNVKPQDDSKDSDKSNDDSDEKSGGDNQEELNVQEQQKLELLRDLAVENNVWIDTLPEDAKPADEIEALIKALKEKNIQLNIG